MTGQPTKVVAKGGKALIFSAPSGSGKTTLVKYLLQNNADLGFSISASTRDKRGRTEQDGKDYHFLSPEEFKKKIDNDEFVEWEEVYEGNFYGTLKSEIERLWSEGKHVIFDVDVKGGLSLKKYFGDKALAVFVKVPSLDVLNERLKDRGTESEESLSRRLFKARFEMSFENQFDVVLVNEDLEQSLAKAQELYVQFKKR
jgi:guanylate kinase